MWLEGDGQRCDGSSYSNSHLVTPGGIVLTDSEKAEAFAESLEVQFQPAADTHLKSGFIDSEMFFFQEEFDNISL